MDFWTSATDSVKKAVDFVVDQNRKTAMMNRLKIVIKSEKEAQNHAYAQLGKYFYQNMRDPENGDTEPYCQAVDTSETRLKRAYAKLDELAVPTSANGAVPPDETDGECDDDFGDVPPAEDDAGFHPDAGFRADAEREETADEDQDYLHPFSVVPNDGAAESVPGTEEKEPEATAGSEEKAPEGGNE